MRTTIFQRVLKYFCQIGYIRLDLIEIQIGVFRKITLKVCVSNYFNYSFKLRNIGSIFLIEWKIQNLKNKNISILKMDIKENCWFYF